MESPALGSKYRLGRWKRRVGRATRRPPRTRCLRLSSRWKQKRACRFKRVNCYLHRLAQRHEIELFTTDRHTDRNGNPPTNGNSYMILPTYWYVNTQATCTAYRQCSLIGLKSLIWYGNHGNSPAAVDPVKVSVETDKEATKNKSSSSAQCRHRIENAQIQGRHSSCQVLMNIRHTCIRRYTSSAKYASCSAKYGFVYF